jgi:hypothetical protein
MRLKIERNQIDENNIIIYIQGNCDVDSCYNPASIRCNDCKACFCEDCSKKIHKNGALKNHELEKIISKGF